jgi:cytochrome b561
VTDIYSRLATPSALGDAAVVIEERYDGVAIALHWITAILVLTLFSLAHIWDFFPREAPERSLMQTTHVSLGVVLAGVLAFRLVWRIGFSRRVPPANSGLARLAASGAHGLLYALLIVMVVAGFGKRWVRQHGVEFFGLHIPPLVTLDPAWRPALNAIHHWGAWAIITIAGLHAVAALFHHFMIRDRVLTRMLPRARPLGAG